jgi:hypothetical protein
MPGVDGHKLANAAELKEKTAYKELLKYLIETRL